MLNQVLAVNRQTQMAAVRTSDGITVFSWDSPVELLEGDLLTGELRQVDSKDHCFNTSVGMEIGVMVVATHCSDDGAVQLLFI